MAIHQACRRRVTVLCLAFLFGLRFLWFLNIKMLKCIRPWVFALADIGFAAGTQWNNCREYQDKACIFHKCLFRLRGLSYPNLMKTLHLIVIARSRAVHFRWQSVEPSTVISPLNESHFFFAAALPDFSISVSIHLPVIGE